MMILDRDNDCLFIEVQKFKQWWFRLLLISINGFFIYGLFTQLVMGTSFCNNAFGNTELIVCFVTSVLSSLLIMNFKLVAQIKVDGIYVKFFPMQFKFKKLSWIEIDKIYIRKYKPILEYGGWGFRGIGKNRSYTISGNMGLQIEFKNGSKLLIGTNKVDELSTILNKIEFGIKQ